VPHITNFNLRILPDKQQIENEVRTRTVQTRRKSFLYAIKPSF